MPPEMMVGEIFSQGSSGLLIAIVLTKLRAWFAASPRVKGDCTKLIVALSHFGCVLSSFGVHWLFEGDMLSGGVNVQFHIPDVYHLANAAILYGSNIGVQKGWALAHKTATSISALAKAWKEYGPAIAELIAAAQSRAAANQSPLVPRQGE